MENIKLFPYEAIRLYSVKHPYIDKEIFRTGRCMFHLNDVDDVVEMDPEEFEDRKVLTICTATKDFFIEDTYGTFIKRWKSFIEYYNSLDEDGE